MQFLVVLGFNDMSTLVGHFVSREIEGIVEEMRGTGKRGE